MTVQEMMDRLDDFGGHLPVYVGPASAEEPPRGPSLTVETETVEGVLAVVVRPVS